MIELLLFAAAAVFQIEQIKVSETGEQIPIRWCHSTGQNTDDWTHTIQVVEFPPGPAPFEVPTNEFTVVGNVTEWLYTPRKAGIYYIRARSCSDADGCSPWGISIQQESIEGCLTDPTRIVWYFKLATPTGGGIE